MPLAGGGRIDPVAGLQKARVWLFSGTRDRTVQPAVVDALRRYYAQFTPAPQVVHVRDRPTGHGFVTAGHGNACSSSAPPFLNDCGYDAAGALLQHLYGRLDPPAAEAIGAGRTDAGRGAGGTGRLLHFDQREFMDGARPAALSLAETGYAYVPRRCEAGGCRVHVAFHGCRQNAAMIGEAFVRDAGYNRWAEANGIVVLYPQTIAHEQWETIGGVAVFVFNPRGCWDWWGYTGPLYHSRDGPQMRAVRAMVDRLRAPR